MNPFELQAELMRQWLGLASAMASATMAACNDVAQQSTAVWSRGLAGEPSRPPAWPLGMWPSMGAAQPSGFFPISNPFMPSAMQASWPMMAPWASMMGWQAPVASPMQAFAPMLQLWTGPWTAMLSQPPWWMAPSRPRNPGTELIDQAATTYRTASGYAVAAVMGPFGAALDPRTYGQPWWQSYQGRRPS